MAKGSINSTSQQISIGNLPKGFYILQVVVGDEVISQRIVKK
jgi:hypothetical protein